LFRQDLIINFTCLLLMTIKHIIHCFDSSISLLKVRKIGTSLSWHWLLIFSWLLVISIIAFIVSILFIPPSIIIIDTLHYFIVCPLINISSIFLLIRYIFIKALEVILLDILSDVIFFLLLLFLIFSYLSSVVVKHI